MAHKYFDRKPDDWNITGFLNECEIELFRDKIGCYLTSLANIINAGKDEERCKRANLLYDRYKKASTRFLASIKLVIWWRGRDLQSFSAIQVFKAEPRS